MARASASARGPEPALEVHDARPCPRARRRRVHRRRAATASAARSPPRSAAPAGSGTPGSAHRGTTKHARSAVAWRGGVDDEVARDGRTRRERRGAVEPDRAGRRALERADLERRVRGTPTMPGSGVTAVTSSGGIGPANTTHRPPVVATRSHVYGETVAGAALGRPPPGKVPAPRSLARRRARSRARARRRHSSAHPPHGIADAATAIASTHTNGTGVDGASSRPPRRRGRGDLHVEVARGCEHAEQT